MPAKKFRFSLAKVLDLRAWEEKQAENDLAAKTGQCSACERAIEDLLVRRRNAFPTSASGAVDLASLAHHEAFRLRLAKEIDTKQKLLARLTVEREDLLKVYLEKRQRREVLTKLSEKQALAFKQAQEKREMLRLDDLNTAAFIRKMKPAEDSFG